MCCPSVYAITLFFFFNDTATTEIYTLSLHDALPTCCAGSAGGTTPSPRTTRPSRSAPTRPSGPSSSGGGTACDPSPVGGGYRRGPPGSPVPDHHHSRGASGRTVRWARQPCHTPTL